MKSIDYYLGLLGLNPNDENDKKDIDKLKRLHKHLRHCLTDVFFKAYEFDDTVELMANGNGVIYHESLSNGMVVLTVLPPYKIQSAMNHLASFFNKELTINTPILECEFPLHPGSRFSGIIPPVVVGPTFSLRKAASLVFTIEQYIEAGIMTKAQGDLICSGIEARKNFIVVGGTGSGKTTLLNAFLEYAVRASPDTRFIIMQDTSEIQCNAANKVFLHTTNDISLSLLLKSTLRLRPDRIIVGEVRDGAALDMLDSWNTGHPGGFATIHANSAMEALARLEGLITRNPSKPDDIKRIIGMAVDYIVFIEKTATGRKVSEIIQVSDYDNNNYVLTGYGPQGL